MKKPLLRFGLLLCSVVLLTACFPPKTPQEVAAAFWQAVVEYNADGAVEYSTLTRTEDYDGFSKEWSGFEPTWGKVVIDGDEASVVTELASPVNSGMEDRRFTTYLLREEDKWLVDYARTKQSVQGGLLGSLFGSLSRLGEDMSREFESSARGFQDEMERMSRELEAMSAEIGKKAQENLNQYAEELRQSIKELEESIDRALKDKENELSDEDRRVLKEVAADLEKDRDKLSNPTPENIAESSIDVGQAQIQLESIKNNRVDDYKKQWRDWSEQFERDMQQMLEELKPKRSEVNGTRI